MPKTPQELFESGKTHLENDRLDEAVSDFTEAIRLEPENADYPAWLAIAFCSKTDFIRAMELSNKALQLNPSCFTAYRARGYCYREQKNYSKALEDYSKSIGLNPQDYRAYCHRAFTYSLLKDYGKALQDFSRAIELEPKVYDIYSDRADVYYALNDFENYLLDKARSNRRSASQIGKWPGREATYNLWYETIYQHLISTILPRLANDESVVEYFPCFFSWDKKQEVVQAHGTIFTRTSFRYGSGYVCVTTKGLYLVSLGRISQQFPLYEKDWTASRQLRLDLLTGGLDFLGQILDSKYYERQSLYRPTREPDPQEKEQRILEKADQVWTVLHQSAVSAQIVGRFVSLTTPAMTWEIYEHFQDQLRQILVAINLGVSGKYAHLWEVPKTEEKAAVQPSKDVVTLLKQLNELKEQSIITEAEFEQKKKELLARL